jgi:hypothetical protein
MDRAMMYMLRDVDPLSQVQFTSSGLIGPVRNFSAKPSWYYVSTLRNVLTGLVFESERTSLSGEVIISKFEDLKNSKSVYVLWCPLENCVIAKYRLPVEGTLAKARLVSLKHREKSGVFLPLEIHENTIEVDVSGTPVFVEVQ